MSIARTLAGWQRVQFQSECDPDGDGWCQVRDCDPADCDCIGPTQDGVEYQELDGVLYGRMPGGKKPTRQPKRPRPVSVRLSEADLKLLHNACEPHESLSECIRRLAIGSLF